MSVLRSLEKLRGELAPLLLHAIDMEDGTYERKLVMEHFGTADVAKKFAIGWFSLASSVLSQIAGGPARLTKEDHTVSLTRLAVDNMAILDTMQQSKEDWAKPHSNVIEAAGVSDDHLEKF